MSKRKGDVQVMDYKVGRDRLVVRVYVLTYRQHRGWESRAILNWLALAGWGVSHEAATTSSQQKHAPDSTAIMSLEEMIREVHIPALYGIHPCSLPSS